MTTIALRQEATSNDKHYVENKTLLAALVMLVSTLPVPNEQVLQRSSGILLEVLHSLKKSEYQEFFDVALVRLVIERVRHLTKQGHEIAAHDWAFQSLFKKNPSGIDQIITVDEWILFILRYCLNPGDLQLSRYVGQSVGTVQTKRSQLKKFIGPLNKCGLFYFEQKLVELESALVAALKPVGYFDGKRFILDGTNHTSDSRNNQSNTDSKESSEQRSAGKLIGWFHQRPWYLKVLAEGVLASLFVTALVLALPRARLLMDKWSESRLELDTIRMMATESLREAGNMSVQMVHTVTERLGPEGKKTKDDLAVNKEKTTQKSGGLSERISSLFSNKTPSQEATNLSVVSPTGVTPIPSDAPADLTELQKTMERENPVTAEVQSEFSEGDSSVARTDRTYRFLLQAVVPEDVVGPISKALESIEAKAVGTEFLLKDIPGGILFDIYIKPNRYAELKQSLINILARNDPTGVTDNAGGESMVGNLNDRMKIIVSRLKDEPMAGFVRVKIWIQKI